MVLHGIVMDAGKESQADRVVKFYAKVTARTAAKTAPPRAPRRAPIASAANARASSSSPAGSRRPLWRRSCAEGATDSRGAVARRPTLAP
jgi:hypothetical protein